MQVAFTGHCMEADKFAERIGMIVGADTQPRIILIAVDDEGGGLPAALVAAGIFACLHRQEQAFGLRRFDARYRLTGRYLDAMLPENAVVLAAQQSGSIHHYAHVPIVRWDMLHSDLDGTLAALRALGRHPFILIEDWEKPDFAARFRTSPMARLIRSPLRCFCRYERLWPCSLP